MADLSYHPEAKDEIRKEAAYYQRRRQGRSEEEIAVYEELAARYGAREESAIAEQVAKALVNKGVSLGALDRIEVLAIIVPLSVLGYGSSPTVGS